MGRGTWLGHIPQLLTSFWSCLVSSADYQFVVCQSGAGKWLQAGDKYNGGNTNDTTGRPNCCRLVAAGLPTLLLVFKQDQQQHSWFWSTGLWVTGAALTSPRCHSLRSLNKSGCLDKRIPSLKVTASGAISLSLSTAAASSLAAQQMKRRPGRPWQVGSHHSLPDFR